MRRDLNDGGGESLGFGLALTAVQVLVYFTFVLMCCFNARGMAFTVPVLDIPFAFAFGLLVILCGIVLTIIYVVRTNRMDG